MRYKVYGDRGYTSQCLLHETDDRTAAVRWAERYADRDFGGYHVIEVAYFAPDGEYVTVAKHRVEDYADEGTLYDEL